MKKVKILFLLLAVILAYGLASNTIGVRSSTPQTDNINIVVLIEDQFSIVEFNGVNGYYQKFGYSITTTGIGNEKTCDLGSKVQIDIHLSDLNISEYDCLYIPGGYSYVAEMENQDILQFIRTAYSEGVVIAAICGAPAVLAAADIINGTRVTGHEIVADRLIAAGANYSIAAAMVDGTIVTGVPPYYEEFAIATAQALGLYETNPPAVSNIILEPLNGFTQSTFTLSAEISDETGISFVTAKIFRNVANQNKFVDLVKILELVNNGEGTFTSDFTISDPGNYHINIEIEDFYANNEILDNVVSFNVTNPTSKITPTSTAGFESLPFLLGLSILAGITFHYHFKKKKPI